MSIYRYKTIGATLNDLQLAVPGVAINGYGPACYLDVLTPALLSIQEKQSLDDALAVKGYGFFSLDPIPTPNQGSVATTLPFVADVVAALYVVRTFDRYVSVNSGIITTVRLPAVPLEAGEVHTIFDASGTASIGVITVEGNGALIDGLPSQPILTNYGKLSVVWTGTFWKTI